MKTKESLRVVLLAAVAAMAAACVAEVGTGTDDEVEQRQGAVLGVDQFLYFRSNATGWGVDETTILSPFAGGAFARTYDVTQTWMISDADTAIVTETNQRDGWGTAQSFFGASGKLIVVPGRDTLVVQAPGGDAHFKVKYGTLGLHRVIVSPGSSPPLIQIDSAASACAGVCPGDLVCTLQSNGIPTCSEPPRTGP
jgi:hypothetical protein